MRRLQGEDFAAGSAEGVARGGRGRLHCGSVCGSSWRSPATFRRCTADARTREARVTTLKRQSAIRRMLERRWVAAL